MLHNVIRNTLLCFGALAVAGLASGAIADTDTRLVGDGSGKPFVSACAPGQAVIGWAYESVGQLTAITAICQQVDSAGRASGDVIPSRDVAGVDGGDSGDAILCKNSQTIQSLDVHMDSNLHVLYIRGVCHGPGAAPALVRPTKSTGGNAEAARKGVDCGASTYATALIGTFGDSGRDQGIRSMGLRCHPLGDPVAAAPDTGGPKGAAGTGNASKPDDTADNDDDGIHVLGGGPLQLDVSVGPDGVKIGTGKGGIQVKGGKPGGKTGSKSGSSDKGKLTFAAQPTTLYARPGGKEIAYLDAGDKVTIIACEDNGQGWCQVSRPQPGYIWGGDLH